MFFNEFCMKRFFLILVACVASVATLKAYERRVEEVYSPSMQKGVPVTVITPDGYAESGQRYDVVYLLHGFGDNHDGWNTKGGVAPLADKYGLIIVCPDGAKSWYWDSPEDSSLRYETFLAQELVGWVDATYRTNATCQGRAISGLSMGGQGALYVALRHPGLFGAVGSTSGGVDIREFPDGWDMAKLLGPKDEYPERWEQWAIVNMVESAPKDGSLVMIIDCGTEDFFYDVNVALHGRLLELGVPHDFYVRPGRHNWHYWKNSIKYQMLFFDNYFENN